jgi:TonB family protein
LLYPGRRKRSHLWSRLLKIRVTLVLMCFRQRRRSDARNDPGRATLAVRTLLFVEFAFWPWFSHAQAQVGGNEAEHPAPKVVLTYLAPPIYPQMATIAGITGDVSLQVTVHPDGSVVSVKPMSGHPILIQAAVDSAERSQFQCQNCTESTSTRSFIYSFQPPQKPPDRCCCSSGATPTPPPPVVQTDDHITITAAPLCVCPDECTSAWAESHPNRVRSLKCLYLWKCSTRPIAIY